MSKTFGVILLLGPSSIVKYIIPAFSTLFTIVLLFLKEMHLLDFLLYYDSLSYFLLDDGDENGGMFLASAYEKMIEWQNDFIDTLRKDKS